MTPTPISASSFRDALSRFASGVTVITARDADGRDQGMTASAFCSLSLHPPLVLVCIGDDATLAPMMATADHYGVSVLGENQEPLSRRFSAQGVVRFDGAEVVRGASGVALLPGALAHIECRKIARQRGGDHTIVVGEVVSASTHEGRPLLHFRGAYGELAP